MSGVLTGLCLYMNVHKYVYQIKSFKEKGSQEATENDRLGWFTKGIVR